MDYRQSAADTDEIMAKPYPENEDEGAIVDRHSTFEYQDGQFQNPGRS